MLEKTSRYAIEIDGKSYAVLERHTKRKGMSLRLSQKEPDTFLLSVGRAFSRREAEVAAFLRASAPKILARAKRPRYHGEGWVYLLGEKIPTEARSEAEISAFLKKEAERYFPGRVAMWKEAMGVQKDFAVRIRDMKSRFGSNCFKTARVFFTTRAICYAPAIIDYLIIHELAHFAHPDHQGGFHRLVASFDPEWKKHERQLQKGIYDGKTL